MKTFTKYMKKYWGFAVAGICCVLLDVAMETYLPILMSNIVGNGLETGDKAYIIRTGVLMIVASAVALISCVGNIFFSSKAGNGFGSGLRKGLFDRVQSFSFKNIDDLSTASLSTRLTNDVRRVQDTIVMGLRMLVRIPVMLVFALTMSIRLNASLARVFIVTIPLLFVAIIIIAPKAMPLFGAMQSKTDRVNRDVQENVTNVRVVKSFVREDYEIKKFNASSDDLMNASVRAMNLMIMVSPLMALLLDMSILAVMWMGGEQIIAGVGNAAQLSAFVSYIMNVLMSVMMAAMMFIMLSRAAASFKRVAEVLNTQSDLTEKPDAQSRKLSGELRFDKVDFKYNEKDAANVLDDISFTASPGQLIAIIGGTGAGKTTLVHLIPRLYDVTSGSVSIDGVDVRDLTFSSLRDAIGVVLQNNTLFSGTIAENLRWGNENATDEQIRAAADAAQIGSFIESLPDGYNTKVEQGGVNFSGGQKQRLCIARAMLKNPAILILDDSTSAVDTATERHIREGFATHLKNTTTLLIAQRISSVMYADKILVLDDGRIVGEGTHEQLLQSCEAYREIYASQTDGRKEA